jgi:hypothetical protein
LEQCVVRFKLNYAADDDSDDVDLFVVLSTYTYSVLTIPAFDKHPKVLSSEI